MRGNKVLRLLDRSVGVAAVLMLAPLRLSRSRVVRQCRRIGLMKTVAIGDTVLLAGVVADVRQRFPNATLVLITGNDNKAVGEMILEPGDEHVVVSPSQPLASAARLRRARLDILLDFGAWPRFDAVLTALSGARMRVGFRTAGQHRHYAYDLAVEYSGSVHEVDNDRRLAAAAGVESRSEPRIRASDSGAALPVGPYVIFHPWASGTMYQAREWSTERWVDLARHATGLGLRVVLSGSPADRSKSAALAGCMIERGLPVDDAAGRYTLRQMTDVLASSSALVSVNTGIMHLGAALGTPTVGLHGPTSSRRWGPVGRYVRSVDSECDGCGYLNLGWEYQGRRLDCMKGISVEAVRHALVDVMTEAGVSPGPMDGRSSGR